MWMVFAGMRPSVGGAFDFVRMFTRQKTAIKYAQKQLDMGFEWAHVYNPKKDILIRPTDCKWKRYAN